MPKLSLEATFGLIFEVILGILDHLHVREPWIIWGLFLFGLALIVDSVLRGEWAEKIEDALKRKKRRALWMIPVCIGFVLFGWFVFIRSKEEGREQSAKEPQISQPATTNRNQTKSPDVPPKEEIGKLVPRPRKKALKEKSPPPGTASLVDNEGQLDNLKLRNSGINGVPPPNTNTSIIHISPTGKIGTLDMEDAHINFNGRDEDLIAFREWKVAMSKDAGTRDLVKGDFDDFKKKLATLRQNQTPEQSKIWQDNLEQVEQVFMKVADDRNATLDVINTNYFRLSKD